MAAATLLAIGAGFSAVSSIMSSSANADALRAQGEHEKNVADFNEKIALIQSEDALYRGDKEATQLRKNAKRLVGSQRAALAAQGVNVDVGSAALVQEDTMDQAKIDEITIRNNAAREAWGYKVQARGYSMQGSFASMAGENAARSTALTGGINALGYAAQAGAYGYKAYKGVG